jgi:hypothetical protein
LINFHFDTRSTPAGFAIITTVAKSRREKCCRLKVVIKHYEKSSVFSGNKIANISEVNMYCPKCSQQQISDDIRFCSRCGFQLNIVKALLADNGKGLTQTSATGAVSVNSQRKKDMKIGAVLMSLLALRVAWVADDLSLEREFILLIVNCLILCALINVIPLIRDFFRRKAIQDSSASPKILSSLIAGLRGNSQNSALPPAYNRPTTDYFATGINTAEIVAPPSVTEETTNLLINKQN